MSQALATKLRPPEPPTQEARPRLLSRLDGLTREYPVVLLQAPAGYGKTTLLSAWTKSADRETLWYSFDPDDTLEVLACHLCKAAGIKSPGARDFLSWLSQADPLVLVLEDCHLATEPALLRYLEALCHRRSENARLVLSSRGRLPLNLGRLEVRAVVGRLESQELALTESEFLRLAEDAGEDPEVSRRLYRLSEGWPACSAHLLRSPQTQPLRSDAAASNEHVRQVLEEAFGDFSPQAREAFCILPLLEGANPDLAQAVGVEGKILDLASFPIIREGNQFRLHRLLAAYLRERAWQELGEDRQKSVHQRASLWHERFGEADLAIHHGLLGHDWARAGRLLTLEKRPADTINLYRQSLDWLQSIPRPEMDAVLHSRLGLAYWSAMRWQDACRAFTRGLGSGRQDVEFLCLGGLAKCHDSLGLVESSRSWASKALEVKPEQPCETSSLGRFMLSATLAAEGRIEEADRMLGECADVYDKWSQPLFAGNLSGMLRLRQARLAEAERLISGAIELSRECGHTAQERVGLALLACCQYEGGRLLEALDSARRYLTYPAEIFS